MRKLVLSFLIGFVCFACKETERPSRYVQSTIYELQQASEYKYSGQLEVGELPNGDLEFVITLKGEKGSKAVTYPAHLHYGPVGTPDAPMAAMLNPVYANSLDGATILNKLANGNVINYESFKLFNGHVKVHLASDGPDYEVILVEGNVGANYFE
ncbi:hypothetical protein JYB64_08305 [Algoriphagus aestuarii]|nr:hypothetical protein [Algoriphagus aestuarii]